MAVMMRWLRGLAVALLLVKVAAAEEVSIELSARADPLGKDIYFEAEGESSLPDRATLILNLARGGTILRDSWSPCFVREGAFKARLGPFRNLLPGKYHVVATFYMREQPTRLREKLRETNPLFPDMLRQVTPVFVGSPEQEAQLRREAQRLYRDKARELLAAYGEYQAGESLAAGGSNHADPSHPLAVLFEAGGEFQHELFRDWVIDRRGELFELREELLRVRERTKHPYFPELYEKLVGLSRNADATLVARMRKLYRERELSLPERPESTPTEVIALTPDNFWMDPIKEGVFVKQEREGALLRELDAMIATLDAPIDVEELPEKVGGSRQQLEEVKHFLAALLEQYEAAYDELRESIAEETASETSEEMKWQEWFEDWIQRARRLRIQSVRVSVVPRTPVEILSAQYPFLIQIIEALNGDLVRVGRLEAIRLHVAKGWEAADLSAQSQDAPMEEPQLTELIQACVRQLRERIHRLVAIMSLEQPPENGD